MSDLLLHWMPRVSRDIDDCIAFVGRQSWGKPQDRTADIYRGIDAVCAHPERRPRELHRPESGLWLRRRRVAQFVIVYAYIPAKGAGQPNIVSIRAVKHGSVANVFDGVREPQVRSSIGTRKSDCIIDHEDDVDWNNIIPALEAGCRVNFLRRALLRARS